MCELKGEALLLQDNATALNCHRGLPLSASGRGPGGGVALSRTPLPSTHPHLARERHHPPLRFGEPLGVRARQPSLATRPRPACAQRRRRSSPVPRSTVPRPPPGPGVRWRDRASASRSARTPRRSAERSPSCACTGLLKMASGRNPLAASSARHFQRLLLAQRGQSPRGVALPGVGFGVGVADDYQFARAAHFLPNSGRSPFRGVVKVRTVPVEPSDPLASTI